MDRVQKQLPLYKVMEWKAARRWEGGGHTPTDSLTRRVVMQELAASSVASFQTL